MDNVMLEILVVDDEPLARARLVRMIEELDGYAVSAEAANTAEALAQIDQVDPDIVLLDIQMPGDNGLSAARQIGELDDPPALIFCTAFDEHALEAFATVAVGYLLKPVRREHLHEALRQAAKPNKLQRAATGPKSAPLSITAKTHRGVERIPLSEVRFFLADQKYVTVYHTSGQHLLDNSLKELEQMLGDRVVRVHRNALVVIEHIRALERNPEGGYCLRLTDMEQRPSVSRRHAGAVKALLQSL
ncbi:LytTR family DNA-binding domain-containing protein [Gilvimarinus sp. DA14]|uniref:LytR/AlgR family response regulator transcription factor n=1 Tax=Gilvimarinus sp. DA14 TaxID=2956798 RepID=UPI0020B81C2B|nr:LytTR family DNA-binding domain-containing protein [Gilvimarinus sp. DA14]UTF58704.1 LytTR family DNA-binding domain-containing protein [Gilvimarinus sp. DA14]